MNYNLITYHVTLSVYDLTIGCAVLGLDSFLLTPSPLLLSKSSPPTVTMCVAVVGRSPLCVSLPPFPVLIIDTLLAAVVGRGLAEPTPTI